MNTPAISRLFALTGEFKALASGSWELFRQEMAEKLSHTRQQTLWMLAGTVVALTAIFLTLSGVALLLSQLLVMQTQCPPLLATGCVMLGIAGISALSGWCIYTRSGQRLKSASLKPTQTFNCLKSAAISLTFPQPTSQPNTNTEFMNASQTLQDTLHETANTVAEATKCLKEKLNPGAVCANVMTWVDAIFTTENRALAKRALKSAATLPRRFPLPTLLLGVGGACMLWRKAKGTAARNALADYASEQADKLRSLGADAKHAMDRGVSAAVASGCEMGSSLCQSATGTVRDVYEEACNSLSEGVDHLADSTRQLRKEAQAGYDKAKAFAKEEPALAIAGGVALALGAILLVRSARK